MTPRRAWLLLLTTIGIVFLVTLGYRDHLSSAEARGPLVARDILQQGRILPPHLLGEPYLNKPPFFHLSVALSFLVLGESEFSSRLPSLLPALLVLFIVFKLSSSSGSRRRGFVTAGFLGTTSLFLYQARSAEMEHLLTAGVTIAYAGILIRNPARIRMSMALVAAGSFAATLTKGPLLALLFPSLLLAAEIVLKGNDSRPWGRLARLFTAAFAGTLFAAALYYGPLLSDASMRELLWERLALKNVSHARPWHYHLLKLPFILAPAWLILPFCRKHLSISLGGKRCLLAFGLGLLFFTFSSAKQSHYLLPLFPLLALGVGETISARLIPSAANQTLPNRRAWIGVSLAGAAFLLLLMLDLITARAGNEEKSAREAMQRLGAAAKEFETATFDLNLAAVSYLPDEPVHVFQEADEARDFLRGDDKRRLIVVSKKGRPLPEELRDFFVLAAHANRKGDRTWLLLGPAPG